MKASEAVGSELKDTEADLKGLSSGQIWDSLEHYKEKCKYVKIHICKLKEIVEVKR